LIIETSVNPFTNHGNSTCEHCFAMYVLIFWIAKYERKSCLNSMIFKCYHVLNLSKPDFLKFIWIFIIEITFKSISPTFWIQINYVKSCWSRSFQHQRHIPIHSKFSAMI
jgi:hypothetical protein